SETNRRRCAGRDVGIPAGRSPSTRLLGTTTAIDLPSPPGFAGDPGMGVRGVRIPRENIEASRGFAEPPSPPNPSPPAKPGGEGTNRATGGWVAAILARRDSGRIDDDERGLSLRQSQPLRLLEVAVEDVLAEEAPAAGLEADRRQHLRVR